MKYKCIIFDCDGVLVDSEEITNSILVEMANSIGAKIDMKYALENFVGKSFNDVSSYIENLIDKELPVTFEKEYRKRTFQAFKENLKPIKGIHDLLNKLSIPYCVASSGSLEKIKMNLTTTQLIEKFENNNIFSSYEIGSWKPNPEIFEYAAKKMGYKPNECVVIEDSIVGIQAAISGGFEVFGFTNKFTTSAFKNKGVKTFSKMSKLVELLKE